MPKIIPFRGVVYNKKKIGSFAKVVAPPYDVIPKKMQDELYRKSPYNMARIELAKIKPDDNDINNRYTRSAGVFEKWLKDKVMTRDEKEAIYIYSQEYRDGPEKIERIGFFALMDLDEGKKKVLPHENTLAAPKADRLELIRKIKANLSPIFILYDDKEHKILNMLRSKISKIKPYIDVSFEGSRNRAWRLDSPEDIKKIQCIMKQANTFIADGHHRFEVSRNYSEIINNSDATECEKRSSRYVMAYFVESKEDMLTVLPTHRAVKDISGLNQVEIESRLADSFDIKIFSGINSAMKALQASKDYHSFVMYFGRKRFYLLKLKSMRTVDKIMVSRPRPWRQLDVAILHFYILQHLLDVKDEEGNIEFFKDAKDAVNAVERRKFGMAFFLNATKVSDIKNIAKIGEKMPRKATYFYPKPVSGIVLNRLI